MSGSLRQPPPQVHPFPLAQHAGSWLISAFISLCSSWVWKCTHLISAILECEIKHSSVWAPALVTQVFNWSLKNLVSYMRVSPIRKGSSKTWYSLCWCFPLSERGWDLLCPTPTYLGIISEEIRSSLFWGQFVLIICVHGCLTDLIVKTVAKACLGQVVALLWKPLLSNWFKSLFPWLLWMSVSYITYWLKWKQTGLRNSKAQLLA